MAQRPSKSDTYNILKLCDKILLNLFKHMQHKACLLHTKSSIKYELGIHLF